VSIYKRERERERERERNIPEGAEKCKRNVENILGKYRAAFI
jgi:hypothetical protein